MKRSFFKREEEATITYDAPVGEKGIDPFSYPPKEVIVPSGNITIYAEFKFTNNLADTSTEAVPKDVVDASVADGTGVLYETQDEMDEALSAIRKRILAYPSLEEQFDMQYNDKLNNTTTWENTVAEVKKKYPKPE